MDTTTRLRRINGRFIEVYTAIRNRARLGSKRCLKFGVKVHDVASVDQIRNITVNETRVFTYGQSTHLGDFVFPRNQKYSDDTSMSACCLFLFLDISQWTKTVNRNYQLGVSKVFYNGIRTRVLFASFLCVLFSSTPTHMGILNERYFYPLHSLWFNLTNEYII